MNETKTFDFTALVGGEQIIRKVRVVDLDGAPWFVASDVCRVLGIENTSNACRALGAADQKVVTRSTNRDLFSLGRGSSRLVLVSEKGFYDLITRSDKPVAKTLRDWVTGTVLPSIRKVRVVDLDGAPWFVASDVCEALGYTVGDAGVKQAIRSLEEDERRNVNGNTLGICQGIRGNPTRTLIAEKGLYKLINRAQRVRPEVVAQDVCEVLGIANPSDAVRSLGRYEKCLDRIEVNQRGNPKEWKFHSSGSRADGARG